MLILYSELVNKFQDKLGTPKELIIETFNKPDATDVVKNKYISIKKFDEFYILIIFETIGNDVKILNAYHINSKLLDGVDISKMRPLDALKEFMNRYGMIKSVPGIGDHKIFVEKNTNVYFLGILDIDKYLEAMAT